MDGLHAFSLLEPGPVEGGSITFEETFMAGSPQENAVGNYCKVVRFEDGEPVGEVEGAVESVAPFRVALNGGGWQPAE